MAWGSETTMSPGMAGAGVGLALLGSGLNYLGQRKGAKAMEEEAARQAAEQLSFSKARRATLDTSLDRVDPTAAQHIAGADLATRTGASTPAISAGSTALGLGGGSRARIGQALLPMQRVASSGVGQAEALRRSGDELGTLNRNLAGINEGAQLSSALYPMRTSAAGSRGAMERTGGDMMSGAGMALAVAGMNQEAQAPDGGLQSATGRADAAIPTGNVSQSEALNVAGQRAGYIDMADLPQASNASYGSVPTNAGLSPVDSWQQAQGQALYGAWPQIRDAGALYGLRTRGAWNRARAAPPPRPVAVG